MFQSIEIPPEGENPVSQWDMVDHIPCPYSKAKVIDAGEVLRTSIAPSEYSSAVEAFNIAHSWRNSLIYPMHMIKRELSAKARKVQANVITGARLKRMQSIRRKLRESPRNLYQMQDIGGCRAVLDSMAEVNLLLGMFRNGESRHGIVRENDYFQSPKDDGYRCHHVVLKFFGSNSTKFNRHFVEVQLRTRLQHAWATAVEAVGLVRNENLKAGDGHAGWLRFFRLVSAEFALEENGELGPGVSEDKSERILELRGLEAELNAVKNLESYNQIIKFTENFSPSTDYYLIQYIHNEGRVIVTPYYTSGPSPISYIEEERRDSTRNTVLVEVDKADDLRAAFPNYFLDVKLFTDRLKKIIADPNAPISPDFSWLRSWRNKKP